MKDVYKNMTLTDNLAKIRHRCNQSINQSLPTSCFILAEREGGREGEREGVQSA